MHDTVTAFDVRLGGNPRRRLLGRSKGGAVVEVVYASHGTSPVQQAVYKYTGAQGTEHSPAREPVTLWERTSGRSPQTWAIRRMRRSVLSHILDGWVQRPTVNNAIRSA